MTNYPDLASAIRGVCEQWCQKNSYTDLFCRNGEWWAFPPHGVMPVRLKDAIAPEDNYSQEIRIDRVSIFIMPDGSLD